MENQETLESFLVHIRESLASQTFAKITLSKSTKETSLVNIYAKLVQFKQGIKLSITYRSATQDKVENFDFEEGIAKIKTYLGTCFLSTILFTTQADIALKFNKKRVASIIKQAPTFKNAIIFAHDDAKVRKVEPQRASYLQYLGIVDEKGVVIPSMSDKYKQIDKFVEIIDAQFKKTPLKGTSLQVVDMGSGKGYLTFALYDYLTYKLGLDVRVLGIELRSELVQSSNEIARKCNFKQLSFENNSIEQINLPKIDVLIALHACDIATDDAIFKGISAKAQIIICAPCCHKELRHQIKTTNEMQPLLKYGIFEERQAEMLTDGIRALSLESRGYKTKVFEFVSNEHTRKNLMIIGTKTERTTQELEHYTQQLDAIKKNYNIQHQRLDVLLNA